MNIKNNSKSAFTLVELSIVLVIIGLIVASVTAGRSLIRAAQIRSLVTAINTVETGINSFNDRYNAIPGDFSNAYAVFGNGSSTVGCTTAALCNGSGSGQVDCTMAGSNVQAGTVATAGIGEVYNFFVHLGLAGLIDGSFTGANLPKLKFRNTSMAVRYVDGGGTKGIFGRAGHVLDIGLLDGTALLPILSAMTGADAFEIDTKIDDGVSYTGKVYGYGASGASATTTSTLPCPGFTQTTVTSTGNYNLTGTTIGCAIGYWLSSI